MNKHNREVDKPVIGITMGDPGGIGPEVIAKSLASRSIRSIAHFKLIGYSHAYARYRALLPRDCVLIDTGNPIRPKFAAGKPHPANAKASLIFLDKAIELIQKGGITGLVTAPISKEAVRSIRKDFCGHTEYLAQAFGNVQVEMMFVSPSLKVVTATRHLPLSAVSRAITRKKIQDCIHLTNDALKKYFNIKHPRIAVCGLNPHAGEGGSLGREEKTVVIPAVTLAQEAGMDVQGPYAADTIFYPKIAQRYDAIIAMYHDQGLIPVKTLYFKKLVNLTIGLPFIRTSPAHGTAFDIAGKNKADPSSMMEAIRLAVKLV